MRKFVRRLPGPLSYCNCVKPCSELQSDHVIPKSFLKERIDNPKKLAKAVNDGHNMYSCCENINQEKDGKMLGVDFTGGQNNPHLARSALYMNDTYELNVDEETVHKWEVMSMEMEPWEFEILRSKLIKVKQGNGNRFIDKYPEKVSLLHNINFC